MSCFWRGLRVALLGLALASGAVAQPVAGYRFSSTVAAYQDLTTGTVLGDTLNQITATFNNLPLGFAFTYGGRSYTTASVAVAGYVKLGGAITNTSISPISDLLGHDTVIAPLAGPHSPRGNGELRYATTGPAGSRVFNVQWKNHNPDYNGSSINFQLQLLEAGNRIEFHYGAFDLDTLSGPRYFQVGLRGNLLQVPEDFHNRSVDADSNTWLTSRRGTDIYAAAMVRPGVPEFEPPLGLVYAFDPPAACAGRPAAGTLAAARPVLCPGQNVELSLSGAAAYAPGIAYTFQVSTNNGQSWTTLAGQPLTVFSTPFAGPALYRARVSCGADSATTNSVRIAQPGPVAYAPVLYLQTFDSAWQDRCGAANVPDSAYWTANPTSGPLAWTSRDPADLFLPVFSGRAAIFTSLSTPPSSTPNGYTGDLDLHLNLADPLRGYTLSFYTVAPFIQDTLEVQLSADGGQTFGRVGYVFGGVADTVNNTWNKRVYYLGAVRSATAILRLRGHSDGSTGTRGVDSLRVSSSLLSAVRAAGAAGLTRLAPNPTQGRLTLHFADARARQVDVYNTGGIRISRHAAQAGTLPLDLTATPPGLYLVKVQADGGTAETIRFIKQ